MLKKVLSSLVIFATASLAMANVDLSPQQMDDLLKELAGEPKAGWLDRGTIIAEHHSFGGAKVTDDDEIQNQVQENLTLKEQFLAGKELIGTYKQAELDAVEFNTRYALKNEFNQVSRQTVKYDGGKFLWQIEVLDRNDTVERPSHLSDNHSVRDFDITANELRMFSWNGEKYVCYFRPVNLATIEAQPSNVNGALTAGFIKWGFDKYSYENLSGLDVQGSLEDKTGYISIVINDGYSSETVVLDPSRNYVPMERSVDKEDVLTTWQYADYKDYSQNWIPGTISSVSTSKSDNRVLASDSWTIESVENAGLLENDFHVEFSEGCLIEDLRFEKPLQYYNSSPESPTVNVEKFDKVLQEKIKVLKSGLNLNCAGVSMKYAATKIGRDLPVETISSLIKSNNGLSSMANLIESFRLVGIDALAVNTDIENLKKIDNSAVILHLPGEQHFVVVDEIGDGYARIVDLDGKNICYRISIDELSKSWNGNALVVSGESISNPKMAVLSFEQSQKILGGGDCPGSQCGGVAQTGHTVNCGSPPSCGEHIIYYTRYGCVQALTGECSTSSMVSSKSEPCYDAGGSCSGSGNWTINLGSFCG